MSSIPSAAQQAGKVPRRSANVSNPPKVKAEVLRGKKEGELVLRLAIAVAEIERQERSRTGRAKQAREQNHRRRSFQACARSLATWVGMS